MRRFLPIAAAGNLVLGACSAGPAATPSVAPSGGGLEPVVDVVARNIAFTSASLRVSADTPFRLAFQNEDPDIAHSVAIEAGSRDVWEGQPVDGRQSVTFDVPGLAAGTYTFYCPIHLGMTGTLTAAPIQ